MSKERLEEMEGLLNDYYENIDDSFASTDNAIAIVDKVGYFVNRVQELEQVVESMDKQRIKMGESHQETINNIDSVIEQNKRYREAIENTQVAIQKNLSRWNYKDEVSLHDVFIHNRKLLEGDPHE